jgi:hypothetical protein
MLERICASYVRAFGGGDNEHCKGYNTETEHFTQLCVQGIYFMYLLRGIEKVVGQENGIDSVFRSHMNEAVLKCGYF